MGALDRRSGRDSCCDRSRHLDSTAAARGEVAGTSLACPSRTDNIDGCSGISGIDPCLGDRDRTLP